jgi:hypothetical protein
VSFCANSKGHAEITFDLAESSGLESGIGKVLALGATAPDYFEFGHQQAHSQPANPKIGENHHLVLTRAEYDALLPSQLARSERWHEFYLKASVTAMKQGDRESAAFLLGYAIHNSEDLATHQGLPNFVHAEADRFQLLGRLRDHLLTPSSVEQSGPDENTTRLQNAARLARDDLETFRLRVGPEGWTLFTGVTVGSQKPNPIRRFADLKSWDPRSGVIPPSAETESSRKTIKRRVGETMLAVIMKGPQPPDDIKQAITNKAENILTGLGGREDAMLAILQPLSRSIEDPFSPVAQTPGDIVEGLFDYGWRQPEQYQALSAAEQKMLGETDVWRHLLEEKLKKAKDNVNKADKQVKYIHGLIDAVNQNKGMWREKQEALAKVMQSGPPSIDLPAIELAARRQAAEAAQAARRAKLQEDIRQRNKKMVAAARDVEVSSSSSSYSRSSSASSSSSSSRSSSSSSGDSFRQGIERQNTELHKYDAIVHKVFSGNDHPNFDGAKIPK